MCGIAGLVSQNRQDFQSVLTKMTQKLHQRGPDDWGMWVDQENGVGLAHTRLAILDLSASGHQPMKSPSGRYVISYNGEIYNFNQIKKEIEKVHTINWRGHSDTEVMLAAIELWGLEKALQQFNGMFAFALYDLQEGVLSLVRDRLGIKPLYYGWTTHKDFVFASELKAIEAIPEVSLTLDTQAMEQFFRFKYIPAPRSIYKNIYKLLPGAILTLPLQQASVQGNERISIYWSAEKMAIQSQQIITPMDEKTALEQLDILLTDSINLYQLADVPVGTFLSGGIDSSLVTALAQRHGSQRVKTFTIGFSEKKYNEAEHAKAIAAYLNTEHYEFYVSPEETKTVIPLLANMYDEPFADSSQIPTYIVSRFARERVTVCLSGDGGDELFAGYGRYWQANALWQRLQSYPPLLRKFMGFCAKKIGGFADHQWVKYLYKFYPIMYEKNLMVKLSKVAQVMGAGQSSDLYEYFLQVGLSDDALVLDENNPNRQVKSYDQYFNDAVSGMMLRDLTEYLPGDILTKVDRASMFVSLESRVPLLDHRVVEYAWSLPMSLKYRDGQSKYLLKQLLAKYVPPELFSRPKQGFSVPINRWLNGELNDWANDLLNESKLKQQGLLNVPLIKKRWHAHQNGLADWQYWLWNVLMFEAWLQKSERIN